MTRYWSDEEKANVEVVFDYENKSLRKHRYFFKYTWDVLLKKTTLIMLNPSTTDEDVVDPTIEKCVTTVMEQLTDCGSLIIVNLYSCITPNPDVLFKKRFEDITGSENLKYVHDAVLESAHVILAWGEDGARYHMNHKVLSLSMEPEKLKCFGRTKYGFPIHPSRIWGKPLNICSFTI